MHTARLHAYTDNMGEALEIDEIDRPEIESPDQILVRVTAAGWCHTDNHIVEGEFEDVADVTFPRTLGHENAGVVEAVGADVSRVEPGDEVVLHPAESCGECRPCRLGNEMYCDEHAFTGMDTDGGFAEYLLTQERCAIGLDSLDPVEAAPHADAGLTAYRAVKKLAGELVPGDVVVAIGVGGLGHIGLQLLDVLTPATTVAVDLRDDALALAAALGADHAIDARSEDPARRVGELTERGAAAVVDFVGSDDTLGSAFGLLRQGGTHHVVGYEGLVNAPAQAVVGLEVSFSGTLCGTYTELQELIELAETGAVTVRTSTHPLAEINEIAADLAAGEIDGRAIIQP